MSIAANLSDLPSDLLARAIDGLEEGMAVYDGEETLVFCNSRYRSQLGLIADSLVPGARWREILAACIEKNLVTGLRDADGDWQAECDMLRQSAEPQGSVREFGGRFFDLSYNPMPNGGFFVTRTDVTERVVAERQAAERDRLLTQILEANPIPVVMARLSDGKAVYCSPAAIEMLGPLENARTAYAVPEDRDAYAALLREKGRVEDFRTRARRADGSVIATSLSGALIEFGGETCVVSSISDLTEVQEREALIRRVVEAFPAPVLMNRAGSGEIIYRSPELIELLGDSLDARTFHAVPGQRAKFLAALRETGAVFDYRVQLRNAEGAPFWAAVSGRLTEWEGEEVLVTFTRDLSHQIEIEAELERQREQMFQNEKMMALGGLMAGVAHELNNPLSVVVGHAMMLQDEVTDPDVLRQTKKISVAAERCAKIVKSFLTMARHEPVRMETTDINEVIDTAVEVARYGDALGDVDVEMVLDDTVDPVRVDADQITQVIINLVLNAAQAMADGRGTVTVKSRRAGEHVKIIVQDDGPGIPEELRGRVFEPFFTTKGVGEGTGIGLAMCHTIVTAHDGTIAIETPDGGGARFVVSLPAADGDPQPDESADPQESAPSASRVLVIDDEPDVADLNAEILIRGGYEADVVYSASDAVARLDTGRYDAVLSDLNMPGMDGRAIFEAIAGRRPDLAERTGFLTGDTMGRASQKFLGEAKRPYIEKPVSPQELRSFVARLIAGGAG